MSEPVRGISPYRPTIGPETGYTKEGEETHGGGEKGAGTEAVEALKKLEF